jgi:hypothetical protein
VTLWHVLEHIPEPIADLKEIRRIMRDDGRLVIEVPNSDSPTLRLCGPRWYALDVPRHLQHFSPSTLQQLLEVTGFRSTHRQNLHLYDPTIAAYSIADRLGFPFRPTGVRHLTDNLQKTTRVSKVTFSAFTLALVLLCIPYPLITTLLSGNSEVMTLVARKVSQ